MLNAQYFRTAFAAAPGAGEPRQRIEIHLLSGAVFEIEAVHAIEDDWVDLQVFPPEEIESTAQRARGESKPSSNPATDRMVVAYEAIGCLHFAPAVRHVGRAAGF